MGAPGAGKGTQAKRIADAHGVPHISTGDIFRRHIEEDTELGRQVKQYMDCGHLVPDELACAIVERRIARQDCADGYVLDGFPRSVNQAQQLERVLELREEPLTMVINLLVQDEEIVERLSARRTCPKCGAIFNLKFNPPRNGGACDIAGCSQVPLVQREDDKEETVRERLRVYHETTEPLLGYYSSRGVLVNVNGEGSTPGEVFEKVEEVIANRDEACMP
ncbi:MAG: adenylate kinase [Candidatus Hydrogenedentes bacterium]|nr:adenylate kinase [Candidatus Hydrogenedentota bacterium]